jgi:glycosyltransferase involved in cell wall biosynthesis
MLNFWLPRVPAYDVCIVTHASDWGGTELATAQTARALAERGRRVVILQVGKAVYETGRRRGYVPDAVELTHEPTDQPFHQLSFRFWRRALSRVPAAVYVLEKTWFGLRSVPLDILCAVSGKNYVVVENHVHRLDRPASRRHLGLIEGPPMWWHIARSSDRFHGWVHRLAANQVIACSEAISKGLRDNAGYSKTDVSVVHYGIDCSHLRFDENARREQRRQWNIPDDCFVFGSVGRLNSVKQLDRAIALFKRFLVARPQARAVLVLAGTGPLADALRLNALAEGIEDLVRFPGWVESLTASLSALDCFVLPSKVEGLGFALLEAMACERACVAFDSGGPAEVISDPSLGWLVPVGDEQAFLNSMVQAWSLGRDESVALGRRVRTHVERHFDAAVQMNAVADLILS